jgi:hypothetical protein
MRFDFYRGRDFSFILLQKAQNGCGAHSVYHLFYRGVFPEIKAAAA